MKGSTALISLAAFLLVAASANVYADEKLESATVEQLMVKALGGIPGKQAVMLTVEYPPGGSSPSHRHNANVFVYVLEGSYATQVEGMERVVLKAGETFYESPQDVHVLSANASTTEPAKILVIMVGDEEKPQ